MRLATATAGIGGCLLTLVTSFYPSAHWAWLARLMAIVVVGGFGSILGATVAAFAMGIIEALVLVTVDPTWAGMIFYLALFATLVLRPHGLVSGRHAVRF